MNKNRKTNTDKFCLILVIAALAAATIFQTVQIGQLMKANEFQQEVNIELNERITKLEVN